MIDQPVVGADVSRRKILGLAGAAGVGALLGGCAAAPDRKSSEVAPPVLESTTQVSAVVETPAPPAVAGVAGLLLCRDSWGARPALPGGRRHTITRMTVHHSAEVLADNRAIVSRLREHQRYHQDQQGWIDIAYHVGVDREGNIFELRTPDFVGDTATDYDPTGHFLVLCEGNFDEEQVTEEQLNGAALAFAWASQHFVVPTATLAGHRDFAATACPGASLYAHVVSGDLKRRVDEFATAGPVDLKRICGPEAAGIVAAIEEGH